MNTFPPQRRQARSQRALVLALVIAVNVSIAGFIDRLAGAGPATAELAVAKPAAGAARG
ncbi:MAG TPA: hypothetical protein VIW70_19280 [Rubrivivax sp.]